MGCNELVSSAEFFGHGAAFYQLFTSVLANISHLTVILTLTFNYDLDLNL